MQNFTYYAPTKVFFGRGTERTVGSVLKEHNYHKVLLHYGTKSAKASGLVDTVEASLTESGIATVHLGGVEPNPKIELVRTGAKLALKEGVDIIVAIGGGSVIDSAKGIALTISCGKDSMQAIEEGLIPTSRFPIATVLTISAAGSEMSNSHVISDPTRNLKRNLNHDSLRPDFAFLNPELTFSVSPYQTACGVVDTMMHTLERYFTADMDTELTDRIAEGLLVAVKNAAYVVMRNPKDYDARATLMWASSVSHNGITGCGRLSLFPAHKLEHDVSGLFDHVSHGAGLAVLWPAWARYVMEQDIPRFARLATNVWGIDYESDYLARTALKGIEAMLDFFTSLGMPRSLTELGVPKESWATLAAMSTNDDQMPVKSYVPLGVKEILEIFEITETQ